MVRARRVGFGVLGSNLGVHLIKNVFPQSNVCDVDHGVGQYLSNGK